MSMILSIRLEDADVVVKPGGQGDEGPGAVVGGHGVHAEVLDREPVEGEAAPPVLEGEVFDHFGRVVLVAALGEDGDLLARRRLRWAGG